MIERYKKYEPLFGAWRISRLIGKGSFGEVYEIERDNFGITYKAALKAITIPVDESELNELMSSGMSIAETKQYIKQSAKDIVNEFVLMSKLKGNTNIVSYEDHQVIEHEDKLGWDILMKMELLQPINQYMKDRDFTQKDLVKLGIDLCTALELCEKYSIVHRDIKPENIFVSPNGDFKLGDFGIARSIEKATLGMSKKGTYTYMAPEVYKGENYALTVDIYSLGMVMYKFMNHNRVPFMPRYPETIAYSDRENSLIKRMNGEKIARPDSGNSEKLIAIILKACEYKPEQRYQNAAEMKEDLLEILETVEEVVLMPKVRKGSKAAEPVKKIKQAAPKKEEEPEEIEKTVLLEREELTPADHSPKEKLNLNRWKIPALAAGGLVIIMIALFAVIRLGVQDGQRNINENQPVQVTPSAQQENTAGKITKKEDLESPSAQASEQDSKEEAVKTATTATVQASPKVEAQVSSKPQASAASTQPSASAAPSVKPSVEASAAPSTSATAAKKSPAPVKQTTTQSKTPAKQTANAQTKQPAKAASKATPSTAPKPTANTSTENKPPEIYVDFDE